jgi:hypothetical protein
MIGASLAPFVSVDSRGLVVVDSTPDEIRTDSPSVRLSGRPTNCFWRCVIIFSVGPGTPYQYGNLSGSTESTWYYQKS